ncbi:MAG TPA: non-ribosomal peptide synthase/polyketide synthase [Thermoanaerobaculia bacterium]|nr:non-ribosomal peptide synthase/polyketide synthase [Thermoanaerobaculia bacterium]
MTEPAVRPGLKRGTLGGLLRARAVEQPHRVAYTFLADGEVEEERLTWAGLDARAWAVASALRESVHPGERALLLFPPGLDFIAAFFGCLYAGVVAVPAYPPRPNDRSQSRLRSIARDAEPRAALTTATILAGVEGFRGLLSLAPELAGLRWIPTDTLPDGGAGEDTYEPDPGAVAFLQYTSGSTATPKGVMVTHANLLHNERMIGAAFEQDEDSVVVGWLPLYHDMGLIGNALQPLHAGARCVLMSPVAFLQKPLRWLAAISRYRGTTSGGPNFAYELCARRIGPEEREGLDLSSWRVAFNGAEPVRAGTLERFAEAFAPCGFRAEAFYPCYGLAEATLFVTGGILGRRPQVEKDPADRPVVSCGRPWMGQRVAIADPETGMQCSPGMVGEVWISGPSVAQGYWRRDEDTERDFNAFLLGPDGPGGGPFLRTGDLGFLREGELFVTGRLKDLVILRGRNHYPQDIELTAERSHPDLRAGNGAAFSVDFRSEERLVVVHEVERRRREGLEEIAEAVRRAVAEEHEVQVHEVVLIRAGSLPKTSSGKVQRRLCRELYLRGDLLVVGRSALTGRDTAPESGLALTRGTLAALEPKERRAMLEVFLRERAAAALGLAPGAISPEQPLTALGLDSLAAVELKGNVEASLGLALPLAELLQGAGVRTLAERLLADLAAGAEGESDLPPLRAMSLDGDQPLSPGQKALWFLHRLAPEGGAYNIAVAARVRGLDPAALERALLALVARHEALRTVFRVEGDEPVQRSLPGSPVDLRVEDASGRSEAELAERLEQEAWRPFDLEAGLPLRLRLFARAGGEGVLLVAVHHIVADFWSLGVVAREFSALYSQETGGPAADLEPLPLRFADFVHWQEARLAGPRGERLWAYWRQRLEGVRDLDLPTDHPRPPVQTDLGGVRAMILPVSLAEGVRALGAARGTTLFMTLLAVFQAQLARYASQEDFAVGSPMAGRPAPDLAGLVGYFVNTVALRADLSGEPAFERLLERTREAALSGLEQGDFPFALLTERLRPVRDPSRSPVVQTLFVLQRGRVQDDPGLAAFALGSEGARISLGGLELEPVRIGKRPAQFDLTLQVAEAGGGRLAVTLEHNADLFDGATVERMLGHFRTLIGAAVAEPGARVWDLPLLTPGERSQLLVEWNETAREYPRGLLHQLLEARAAQSPEAKAVVAGSVPLTYEELNRRANRLAHHLRGLGLGPEERVGVCLRRTERMVVALLGVLKAGGAYVPLDPAHPRERLELILEDSGARLVIAEDATVPSLPEGRIRRVSLDADAEEIARESGENPAPVAGPGNLAYLIYTSGSTGRPKAVAIEHRSPVALIHWAREVFAPRDLAGTLAATSIGFDLSVFEIFVPLSWGGRVVLAENALALSTLSAVGEVTLINTVPSALAELVRAGTVPASAGVINLAGEPIPSALVEAIQALKPPRRLYNLYGPSEDTTYSTFSLLTRGSEAPIGRPIANTRVYLLDARGGPVPVGIPGELFLAGEGLARGYLDRPDLTAERFVPDPFSVQPGERLYRTGDLARFRPDGVLDFLGRADHQVKVRGFRVELGEVEAALARHPEVREAVVMARDDGDQGKRLVAYVVPRGVSSSALRGFLQKSLPEPMVPSAFVALDALPLSPNGKLDRRALPDPEARSGVQGAPAAPRTPVEELLAGAVAEVLGLERVGVRDDFFALGGHSLLATRLVSRISRAFGVDLPVSSVFLHPTVERLAARIDAEASPAAPPVTPVPRDGGPVPLSFAQRRLWLLDRIEPGNPAYNVPGAVRLSGPADLPALARSLEEIVVRHEALRTVFRLEGDQPAQVVVPPAVRLPLVDLAALPPGAGEAEAERLARQGAAAPFDLARGPLFRMLVLRLDRDEHLLLLTLHHIVADGWSLSLFLGELAVLYEAFSAGLPSPLAPLAVQYADWAVWQRAWLRGEVLERQLAWWREQLANLAVLEVPTDHPRSMVRSFRGATRSAHLPVGLAGEIGTLARREGATLFMTLLAAFKVLLARSTGAESIPVGSPVANRGRVEVERLIGFFVNTLVLHTRVGDAPSFRSLLARVREVCLGAWAHQDLPFERLVEELRPERHLSQNPLFQVVFLLEEPLPESSLGPLAARARRVETGTSKFDLSLGVAPGERGLAVTLEYDAVLFDRATADRLLGHWRTLLEGIVADPGMSMAALPLLTATELAHVLGAWSGSAAPYPRDAALHELFEGEVRRAPDAVALEIGDERLTYAELDARANRLARRLRRLGVGLESAVGLCVERSAALIVGMLGILKAGGAYVPLDPSYPEERLAFMVADTALTALVTRREIAAAQAPFAERTAAIVLLDAGGRLEDGGESGEPLPSLAGGGHLAYVMYTSGSMGRPKGVEVPHRAVVRLVKGTGYARFGPWEVFLQLAPASFDAATFEIWGALLHGARLAVFPGRVPSLEELGAAVARHKVTTLWLTAGLFHQVVEGGVEGLAGVSQLLAGGDVLSPEHVRRALARLPGCTLINGYGPTENTTFTCCHSMRDPAEVEKPVSIGSPVANTRVHLLDRELRPVPVGVPGELFAAGDGLARGYRNRPDLTAERFVPSPFPSYPEGGERLYRTGDLARWRPSGRIEFLGRADLQVKIRGFRIEPAEIEAALALHPGVADAAVVVRDDLPGGKGLVAYVVPQDGASFPADLRDFLRARLPEPMVPSFFVPSSGLPLNPNGKVDRRALRQGPGPEEMDRPEHVPPRTPLEKALAKIWSEVLGVETIGVHDNFFELGGHSLLGVQVLSRIDSVFRVDLPLVDLFEEPTVAGLAARLKNTLMTRGKQTPTVAALAERLVGSQQVAAPEMPAGGAGEDLPLSFAQRRLWLAELLAPGNHLYNVPLAVRLRGDLVEEPLLLSLAEIVRRHEPLRTVFPQGEIEPVQVVLPPPSVSELTIARADLSGLPAPEREEALRDAIRMEAERPFDLTLGPVARFLLLRLGPRDHVLMVDVHHIATDGWSMSLFFQELAALYGAFLAGRPSPLPALPLRYADFAVQQRRDLESEAVQRQLAWWRRELAGLPALELPTDRPRPPVPGPGGASRPFLPPPDLVARLRALAPAEGVTLFVALLGGFWSLLSRLSGQDDFAVGVPSAGRNRPQTEGLIGFFVNTLVLRSRLEGAPPFLTLLRRARDTVVAAQANQDVPFDRLVEELHPERDPSRSPLFQVMFAFLSVPPVEVRMPGLEAELLKTEITTAKFDLTLSLHEMDGSLGGRIEYRSQLFEASTIDRFVSHLGVLLEGAVADPVRRISELPLLTEAERRQLVSGWNPLRSVEEGRACCLHHLFEERARRSPDALAVAGGEDGLTYGELDARADRLAHHLRSLGVGPEVPVAVCLERSPELIVALLGVLKAGGVYVPFDPAHPRDRLALVLESSGAAVLLEEEVQLLAARSAAPHGVELDPGNLAYVIYTSGSTGRPKGVGVSHAAAVEHCQGVIRAYGLTERDWVLHFASPSFDVALEQVLAPLAAGATLVLRGREVWGSEELLRKIGEQGLTFVNLPTAFWHRWVNDLGDTAALPPSLRLVLVGGEEMSPQAVRLWNRPARAEVRLLNGYGPTEAVITATLHEVGARDGSGTVPIGLPLPGRSAHVLDRHGHLAPVGMAGELALGGILARGYLGRPDLTARSFVPDPFAAEQGRAGERLYRTGDLTRRRPDGALEFLGRIDDQVKVRGFRIEPGEIEAALLAHPAIREAVVLAVPAGRAERRLAAWLVAAGERAPSASELRAFLGERLPDFMLPASFVPLPALPLTPHGKVDRRALPLPEMGETDPHAVPRDVAEELIAGIWSDLLHVEGVGSRDDFFVLGGHSLLATQAASRVRKAFGVDLPVSAVFEAPTPAALAERIAAALHAPGAPAAPALVPLPRDPEGSPLSYSQQRLWFLHRLEPESPAYHVPGALRLRGPLRPEILERALEEIVRRHEALRTVFCEREKGPVQVVLPPPALLLPVVDLGGLPEAAWEAEALRTFEREARRPFDLAAGPLVRAHLIRLGGEHHLLGIVLHHVISDAWSLGIMLRELGALYRAFVAGGPSPLPELPVQYPDFAAWQRRWLSGEMLAREVEHWRSALDGAPEALELPTDRPRPVAPTHAGARRPFTLPADLASGLRSLGRREGWTPFMILLAAFHSLLARLSGQRDVVVGSPIANRNRMEIEGLIGFFTNTLALRLDLSGDPCFHDLVNRARAVTLEAHAHQDLPFEKLVEEIHPERDLARTPVFQVMLTFQNAAPPDPDLPGITAGMLEVDAGVAKFDLVLSLLESPGGGFAGSLEHSRELFDDATAGRVLERFTILLAQAVADPGCRLSGLPLLSAAERVQLAVWNRTVAEVPPDLCVHDLVAAQAARTPEASAVEHGDERLTYAGLMERAGRLARRLRARGAGADVPVGVFLDRSLDMTVALLGVLQAGGAYVPLDPGYPRERLRRMLGEAAAPVVVTRTSLLADLPAAPERALLVDEQGENAAASGPSLPAFPESLAYAIYTSGSTGRPKGVAMSHRALVNLLAWQARDSRAGTGTRTLQFAPVSFDVSFQEIFSTWCTGGVVVLVAEETRRDPEALLRFLSEQRIERTFLPFVALQQLALAAEAGSPALRLREVMTAGEQLYTTPQVVDLFSQAAGAVLHNHYGPTETHAVSSLTLDGPPGRWPERPTVGRPITNVRVFLLGPDLDPVPPGVPGVLHAGGAGLARGYLGRPDLTAECFRPDSFEGMEGWAPGARLYCTGDLARWRPDGTIEFLGRRDHQVKVRGHRIELAEVETALARHPAVAQAVAAVHGQDRGAGAKRLVGYVVFRGGGTLPEWSEIRDFLLRELPEPMVPTAWVRLDSFPRTPSGKVDRRSLPAPHAAEVLVPPRTPVEELLAGIWREVLEIERVGIDQSFFELGGHSLLATRLISRVREVFGVEIPLRRLFEKPILADFAQGVETALAEESPAGPPVVPVPRDRALPLSFAQERLWFLDRFQGGGAVYNVPLAVRLRGALEVPALAAAFGEIVRRHESLRTSFPQRDGEPVQVIAPPAGAGSWRLPVADLAGLPTDLRDAEARRLADRETRWAFPLDRGPLFRTTVLRLGKGDHLLLLNMHHIVSDGWSLGVLIAETAALYTAALAGAPSPLPEMPVQYADFAVWQRAWLSGRKLEEQVGFWRRQLAGASVVELPTDHPRPALQSFRGAEHRFAVDPGLGGRLAALARSESATPFMVLAAALFTLLARMSGQRDLTLGSPIANRNRVETEGLIGFFVNTLVLRADLSRAATFHDLLRQVRETTLGAYAHQDLPFEKLVEELHPDRDLSHTPLFQVLLALQNTPLAARNLPRLVLAPEGASSGTAKFDLSIVFAPQGADLLGVVEYATDLFEAPTAARLAAHLLNLLEGAVAGPGTALAELPLLSEAERHHLLAEWNDTASPAADDPLLHQLFEAQVFARPEAVAAVLEGSEITYGELDARANRLAGLLRRLGVSPSDAVGVWMERSLDMLTSVLGILKAGGAYLPLDASWPVERVETILAGTSARILVAGSSRLAAVEEIRWRLPELGDVVCLDVATPRPAHEPVDVQEVRGLWDFIAEQAVDRVTAGGFFHATGEPFTEAEVDEYRDRVVGLAEPWIGRNKRVLEIGCGSGLILWEIAPRVARYVGLDPSERTQERNRETARREGLAHVELPTGFAHEIEDWPAGSFDLVILASTVQFFPGPTYLQRVLELALRILAPGGAVLVADVMDARSRQPGGRELVVDEGFFRDLPAEVRIFHRAEGFANELRFRYDVVLIPGEGRAPAKRLWTGWHVAQHPAERPEPGPAGPEDVAYIIHTSGSTGAPKGIVVQHRPVVNLIRWVNKTFGVGPGDQLLFVTSLCFDLSVYDVFGTLAAGGTIHVASEEDLRDPERLVRALTSEPITIWDSAPAALQQLAPLFPAPGTLAASPLRLVLLSGDWIPVSLPDQVRAAFPGARVVSLGGATEATIWSNWYPVGEVAPGWPSIPYGRPIANARYHVLDEELGPAPVGVPGPLYIGGDCLCVGYAQAPETTAEKFLPDPFSGRPGSRLYATGDRARYKPDGNLEFLGRLDIPVKVRGYRIELEEIEAALSRHPGVREAVVLAREDVPGDKRLVGYVVPARRPAPEPGELRTALQQTLPDYMVPWTFVTLETLPLTANGKVDRWTLPAPQDAGSGGAYVAPRNELERAVSAVWREVLGVARIGVHDNFFESGGSSLLIAKLHSRLKSTLGVDVPVMELFRYPTIDALARRLAEEPRPEAPQEKLEAVRARTRGRQEALRQMSQARAKRRGRDE